MQSLNRNGFSGIRTALLILTIAVGTLFLFGNCYASSATSRGLVLKVPESQGDKSVVLYQGSYALLIGVSKYNNGWPVLDSIPAEIEQVAQVLEERGFEVTKVIDPDAEKLGNSFENFINSHGFEKNNRLLFFYSGHGYTRSNGKRGYLVPIDAPDPQVNLTGFLKKSLGMNQVLSWARDIESKHALFLFDSCFSGTIFKQKSRISVPKHITRLTIEPVRQFITAGSAGEEVPANSTFTPAFIDGLRYGLADLNSDGYVSATEMGLYLQTIVPEHTNQNPQYGKIRDYDLSRGDFIFKTDSTLDQNYRQGVRTASYTRSTQLGVVQVRSDPEQADVYIDKKYLGSTPLILKDIPPGVHNVLVQKSGYHDESRVIQASAGRSVSIHFNLQTTNITGTLTVSTTPGGAEIIVENEPDYTDGMALQPGEVKLKISKDGYQTENVEAEIVGNEALHLNITLQESGDEDETTGVEESSTQQATGQGDSTEQTKQQIHITANKKKVVHTSKPTMSQKVATQIKNLQSPISRTRRDTAKRTYKKETTVDPAVLAVIEQQLRTGYLQNQTDRQHLDALAWFCNILGRTGDKKYTPTLKMIANSNAHRKVRKYALKNLRVIEKGN